jgi:integrase
MNRGLNKLTALQCTKAKCPPDKNRTLLTDGGGLYLEVKPDGNKTWVLRATLENGKRLWRGLGSFDRVPLNEAREKRNEYISALKDGIDPMEVRRKARFKHSVPTDTTFAQAFDSYVANNKQDWSIHHLERTQSITKLYLMPHFKNLKLSSINDAMILEVLKPLSQSKNATSVKAKSILSSIFDHARDSRIYGGVNPMLYLRNNKLLKKKPSTHSKAIETHKIGEFLAKLDNHSNHIGRVFLYIDCVTALRINSLLSAKWSWLDEDRKVLVIPAAFMKNRKQFTCPLPPKAFEMIQSLRFALTSKDDYIFQGRFKKPLSNNTPRLILNEVMGSRYHVHGFRTTMNVIVTKSRKFDTEVIEAQLSHTNTNKIRVTYLGGIDYLEERIEMTKFYEDYVLNEKAKYLSGETKEILHAVK